MFVCFNRALREHLAQSERGVDNLDIYTFHGVCRHLAGRAGIKLPSYPRDETPQSFWEEELPDALVEAVAAIGEQYDALIVDEAQDLHTHWLSALMCTLRDEKNAPVWLFMDDNQRVYDATLEVPPEFRPYDLTVNCRNTQAIHSEVMKLYEGDVEPEVKGPPGRSIELLQTNDAPATVAGVLERLCGEEEVPPQDVVVLSSHGFDNSAVAHGVDGRFRLVKERVLSARAFSCRQYEASRDSSHRSSSCASSRTPMSRREISSSTWGCREPAITVWLWRPGPSFSAAGDGAGYQLNEFFGSPRTRAVR